jgi:hypothetical protein
MAIRTETVEYAFNVDNTSLATATRRDLAAITLYIPQTTSRTFKSVVVEVSCRSEGTAAFTATLIGIKLGSASFDDDTQTVSWTSTTDQFSVQMMREVTSYFATNFGSGSSQTCQVGMSFTGNATIAHSVKLYITYEYSDADTTRVKTVRIPIESPTAQLTASLASIGTNQVPNLDSFLPEASKTYRAVWFEFFYNDGGNAVTDFSLEVALDAEAGVDICFCEQAGNSGVSGKTIWRRDDMTTNATHDLKARSDATASRFTSLSVLLCVTYEYNASTSTSIMNSLVVPVGNPRSVGPMFTSTDECRWRNEIWIEEPTTLAWVQSGALLFFGKGTTYNVSVQGGTQTARTYAMTVGSVTAGGAFIMHRLDSGGGGGSGGLPTIARGKNTITIDLYKSAAGHDSISGGLMFLNYTSGKDSTGDGARHNQTTVWAAHMRDNVYAATVRYATLVKVPVIPETEYFLSSVGLYGVFIHNMGTGVDVVGVELLANELEGDGIFLAVSDYHVRDSELGWWPFAGDLTEAFDRYPNDLLARADIETSRKILVTSSNTQVFGVLGVIMYVTRHAFTATATGTISGSAGGTVNLYLHRKDTGELLATGSRTGNGSYTLTWYDSSLTCFVDAYEDGTHIGRSNDGTLTLT